MSRNIGFDNVVEVDSLDSIALGGVADGEIVALPFLGEHADLCHSKAAYLIRLAGQRILFGADSNCLDRRIYDNVRKSVGPVQTVFLGMECQGAPVSWLYGSMVRSRLDRRIDNTRRLNGCDSRAAIELLDALGSERVFLYAMGLEPWIEYLTALAPTDDSPQLTEARKVMGWASERGLSDARILRGSLDLELSNAPGD